MHASARKADIGDGKFMLKDAGLNTFGKITLGSYPNTSMTQNDAIENTFRLVVTLLTAFYTSNHAWRIKVKSIGCANPSNPAHYTDASFLTVPLNSSLSNNTTYTYNPAYIQIGDIEDPDAYLFTAPNRYEIWIELSNDEAVNNGWNSLGTIYESYDGLYYYVASTGSTYIANGYYMLAYGYDLASSGWMRIYNGQVVESS